MEFDVIIAAAGKGTRMGQDKMLSLVISNLSTIDRTIDAFLGIEGIKNIIIAIPKGARLHYEQSCKESKNSIVQFVEGGNNRAESVYNGLKLVKSEGVLIHDGARPFVSKELILRVMDKVIEKGSGVPILNVDDSLRKIEDGVVTGIEDRTLICSVQTPQGYISSTIKKAYEDLISSRRDFSNYTDESHIFLDFVGRPHTILGDKRNKKITHPHDIIGGNTRIGCGYDLHRLEKGKKLVICGEHIPFDYGCVAHSDGDVGMHSLIDALLGAIGERDIGYHFKDTDNRYSGIDSSILLLKTMEMLREKNYRINNVSIVIVLEQPKISQYIPKMRERLTRLLELPIENISIAAKTSEEVGEIGSGNAIAAYSVALVT